MPDNQDGKPPTVRPLPTRIHMELFHSASHKARCRLLQYAAKEVLTLGAGVHGCGQEVPSP
jgi:hypothetical protein